MELETDILSLGDDTSVVLDYADHIQIIIDIIQVWYAMACYESQMAVQQIKKVWKATPGDYRWKLKECNKLVMFYLVILAIYIIQLCFWINGKLLQEFLNIILNSESKSQTVIGLGLVAVLIFLGYVIGALCPENHGMFATGKCSDP